MRGTPDIMALGLGTPFFCKSVPTLHFVQILLPSRERLEIVRCPQKMASFISRYSSIFYNWLFQSCKDVKCTKILERNRLAHGKMWSNNIRTSGGLLNRIFLFKALIAFISSKVRSKLLQSKFSIKRLGSEVFGITASPRWVAQRRRT